MINEESSIQDAVFSSLLRLGLIHLDELICLGRGDENYSKDRSEKAY